MSYGGSAQSFYPEPSHDEWRHCQEEAKRIIEITRAFDDPNVASVPNINTSLIEQTEPLNSKWPRHLPRLGRTQVAMSQAHIKSTLSRDKKEVEMPDLSFTKDDLGASVNKVSQSDGIVHVGSALSQDQQKYPISTEVAFRGGELFSGRSQADEEVIATRRSDDPYYEGRYGSSSDSHLSRDQVRYERPPQRRARDYSPSEPGSYVPVHYQRQSRRCGVPSNPDTTPVVLPNATPNPPVPRLRTRRSLPELMSNSLGTEYLNQRITDRTYLEHISSSRSNGAKHMTRFIETLMDEIARLRYENVFLGQQLAVQYQTPFQNMNKSVQSKEHKLIQPNRDPGVRTVSADIDGEEIIVRYNHPATERERITPGDHETVVRESVTSRDYSPLEEGKNGIRRLSYSSESTQDSSIPDSPTLASNRALGTTSNLNYQPRKYQILHIVDCPARQHDRTFRTLPPTRLFTKTKKSAFSRYRRDHLEEQGSIIRPEILNKRNPHISFLVLRFYDCRDIHGQSEDGPESVDEIPGVSGSITAQTGEIPRSNEECVAYLSEHLIEALKSCAQCSFEERDSAIELPRGMTRLLSPYCFIYQHRLRLEAHARKDDGPVREDVANLLDYFRDSFGGSFDAADALFARGLVSNDHISKLFKPSTLLFSKKMNQGFILSSWPRHQGDHLALNCWSWKYDGTGVIRQATSLEVVCESEDPIPIADLECFPMQFAAEAMQKSILSRGRTFWDLKDPGLICYNGRNADDTGNHSNARFMIDYIFHKKYHPASASFFYTTSEMREGRYDDFDPWPVRLSRNQKTDETLLMVMPHTVDGFNFQTKTWELLYVENISKVEWYKTAFTRLVLPSRMKDLIRAMIVDRKVEKHSSDIFYGKGEGLIMLLHGGPGTGKTLSAESVAELAEKPLYRVTCGDIGTEIKDVEQYLEMILSIGKRWDCVLLLDEADVFLEERSLADLKRNSLVSVFLRVLEYYEGILILTSNRVGIFDEAFKSRIQVALHYDNLPLSARKKIWSNFFELLQEDAVDADFAELESHLDDLAAVEMNGRQIRNAVMTARQLARFRNETLDYEHMQTVIKTAGDFNRYIEKLHGHKDDQWAREGRLR